MGTEVFPSLRIAPDSFTREPWFDTTVQRARDGSEFRLDWSGSGWRYSFTVRTVAVNGVEAERAALEAFFLARRGRWDSFYFTDPVDSVQRLVRFGDDSLPARKIAPAVWEYQISLETVG